MRFHSTVMIAVASMVVLSWSAAATAQGLTYETTVEFALNKKVALEGKVGEVELRGVEFLQPAPKGGIGGAVSGTFSSGDEDLKAQIETRLELATTAATKWNVKFVIEFLDAEGTLIDRARGDASLKSEAKLVEIDHTTLKYAVTKIAKVKISAQAEGKL